MLLLRHALLHDPAPRGLRDLLVVGGRVAAIAPSLDVGGLPVETVDLAGAMVIPGLVDPHVHLVGGGGEGGPATRTAPVTPEALLEAGVTTVVGVLGTDGTTRHPRDLLAAVRALSERGIGGHLWTGSYEVPPPTLTGSVRGDVVLIPEVLGVGEIAISDHRSSQPTPHELLRLAADCHVGGLLAGKRARLHLHVGGGPAGLGPVREALASELPAAVFYPTHVNRTAALFEEAIDLARRGAVVDVTAAGGDEVSVEGAIARWLEEDAPAGSLTVSSDAGGSLPSFDGAGRLVSLEVGRPDVLLAGLRRAVAGGIPLERALPCFTAATAAHLGLADRGRIGVGGVADLLVLDDDLGLRGVLAAGRFRLGP